MGGLPLPKLERCCFCTRKLKVACIFIACWSMVRIKAVYCKLILQDKRFDLLCVCVCVFVLNKLKDLIVGLVVTSGTAKCEVQGPYLLPSLIAILF